ncbi:MAG: 50S ribosomal protein L20 [Clostridiales bacterium]|nr:50S ribosomal protein L20 [Clostridiales bacterium]
MARIKRAVNAHKKRRKYLKLAKGYYGAKSTQYRAASEQVRRSLRYAYKGRKLRKRDFRRLWITRINAAARINGLTYSLMINGLKKQNIEVNRKMLADMAVTDASGFAQLAELAKAAHTAHPVKAAHAVH